jgi:hypothetical protein
MESNGSGDVTSAEGWSVDDVAYAIGESVSIEETLIVADVRGKLRCLPVSPGVYLARGATLGRIDDGNGGVPLRAPINGTFLGWLAQNGDSLVRGSPVARLWREDGVEPPPPSNGEGGDGTGPGR